MIPKPPCSSAISKQQREQQAKNVSSFQCLLVGYWFCWFTHMGSVWRVQKSSCWQLAV